MRVGRERQLDAAVALNDIIAELREYLVVSGTAGDVVVAEAADACRVLVVFVGAWIEREVVQRAVLDRVLGPPRRAVRIAVAARDVVV